MNYVVHRFESVASTNELALRMAREGAPEGTVVVGREQTAGRGRYGREWFSPSGLGLYLTLLLRPDMPLDNVWQFGFVASLAAAEAVSDVSRLPARVKWPNDVLLNGKKLCGILVEAQQSAVGSQLCVVIGIGVNVLPSDFPPEFVERASSIAFEAKRPVSIEETENALLARLDSRCEELRSRGSDAILESWRRLDSTRGQDVTVRTPDGIIEGTAVDVDSDGSLMLKLADGSVVCVRAGDAVLGRTPDGSEA